MRRRSALAIPRSGRPARQAEANTPTDIWTEVRELRDLDDVLALCRNGGPERQRLARFIETTALPDDIHGPEILRWRAIVDRCGSTLTREARGAYRAVLNARFYCLPKTD